MLLKTLLLIRFRQALRVLNEVGPVLAILLILVSIPMLLASVHYFSEWPPVLISGLFGAILFSVHLGRKDKHFLQKITSFPNSLIRSEYLILSLPILGFLLYQRVWLSFLLLIAICCAIPFSPYTFSRRFRRIQPWLVFPAKISGEFEWISGLRKNWGFILPLYLAGLVFSQYIAVIPLSLFGLSLVTCGFYQEGEPAIFMDLEKSSPAGFLNRKILRHLAFFWMATIPLALLFLMLHGNFWYIFLLIAFLVSLFPVFAIVLKYAAYRPSADLKIQHVILAIMIAFLCFPFTQPVPLIMTGIYYRKAIINLRNYLSN